MKTFNEYLEQSFNDKQYEQLNESSLSRLWRKYKQCDGGTISGYRGELTYQEIDIEKRVEINPSRPLDEVIQLVIQGLSTKHEALDLSQG